MAGLINTYFQRIGLDARDNQLISVKSFGETDKEAPAQAPKATEDATFVLDSEEIKLKPFFEEVGDESSQQHDEAASESNQDFNAYLKEADVAVLHKSSISPNPVKFSTEMQDPQLPPVHDSESQPPDH